MNMSSKSMGILAIAALLGIVAFFVSLGILDFRGFTSFIIGVIVGIIAWVVLWLGAGEETTAQSGFGVGTGWTEPKTASTIKPAPTPAPALPESTLVPSATVADDVTPHEAEAAPAAKPNVAVPITEQKAAPIAEKPAVAVSKPKAKAAPKSQSAPKAATPAIIENKPETLPGARAGGADDLKKIKGVGPGLEKTLNELGFYHFDQIAAWDEQEIVWVDSRLKFKGRIVRDDWVTQAADFAKA